MLVLVKTPMTLCSTFYSKHNNCLTQLLYLLFWPHPLQLPINMDKLMVNPLPDSLAEFEFQDISVSSFSLATRNCQFCFKCRLYVGQEVEAKRYVYIFISIHIFVLLSFYWAENLCKPLNCDSKAHSGWCYKDWWSLVIFKNIPCYILAPNSWVQSLSCFKNTAISSIILCVSTYSKSNSFFSPR